MYRLSITKVVKNPNYDPEEERKKEERRSRGGYNYGDVFTPETFDEKALTVELTDEEFKAIKKAVLEVM